MTQPSGDRVTAPPGDHQGKYITFTLVTATTTGKTHIWYVETKQGHPLGEVKWFSRWRSYAFYPGSETVYEHQCLRDLADFCERQTTFQREAAKLGKRRGLAEAQGDYIR